MASIETINQCFIDAADPNNPITLIACKAQFVDPGIVLEDLSEEAQRELDNPPKSGIEEVEAPTPTKVTGEDTSLELLTPEGFETLDSPAQDAIINNIMRSTNEWMANVLIPQLEAAGLPIPSLSFTLQDARNVAITGGTGSLIERAQDSVFFRAGLDPDDFRSGETTGTSGGGGISGPSAKDLLAQEAFEADSAQQAFENQLELDGIDVAKAAEIRRQFETDREFSEFVRQFDSEFGQTERRDLGNLGLGLAAEGRLRQQLEMDILRNPADFLARSFNQFGVDSPFGEVTQADLLNRLRDEFANVDSFVSGQEGLIGDRLSSPSGGGGGGAPASSDPNAGFPLSSQGTAIGTRFDGSTERLALEGVFADTSRFQSVNVSSANDLEALALSGVEGSRIDAFQQAFDLAETSGAPQAVIDQTAENLRLVTQEEGLAGAMHGGFIKDKEFLVGDSKKGAEETILNPTGAPLAIVPTPGRAPDRLLRGFAHGTGGIGEDFEVEATPEPVPAQIGNLDQSLLDINSRIEGESDPGRLSVFEGFRDSIQGQIDTNGSGVFTNSDGILVNADTGQLLPTREQLGLTPQDAGGTATSGSTGLDGSFNRLADAAGLLKPGNVTQEGLQQAVFDTAPPAVTSVLEGRLPSGPDGQMRDVTNSLPPQYSRIFTPQQFAALTPDEQQAMRSALAAFNVSLDDYLHVVGQRFGSQRTRARGRLNPLR